jgi:hypothetical protein
MEVVDFYLRYVFKKMTHSSGIKIHQILIFDEGANPETYCENVSTDMSIRDIKETIKIFMYRIEIRYSIHGKKYRAVARESDDVHFPIRKELGAVPRAVVTRARVVTKDGRESDVTRRVRKYAGQNGDFNNHAGCLFFVDDMFPFHDVDEYAKLRLELSDGSVLDLRMNDVLVI